MTTTSPFTGAWTMPPDGHNPDEHDPTPPTLARREALAAIAALGATTALAQSAFAHQQPDRPQPDPMAPRGGKGFLTPEMVGWDASKRQYALPRLKYGYDAMEPHIDAQTMEIHHSKHHAGYVAGLNKALAELEKIRNGEGDPALMKHWSREVAFHGAGHVNHSLFWLTLAPTRFAVEGRPSLDLAAHLQRDFGSVEKCLDHLSAAAVAVEGGGWAWLMWEPMATRLVITQMEKQQNLYLTGAVPLLGVDVWEHAYYLRYQNRRANYVKAWRNLINWPMVDELFALARCL